MMKPKYFLNRQTGEVVVAYSRIHAYAYFKRDGKKLGYQVSFKDVRCIGVSALSR